jgi:hypothetical protein
LGYVIEIISTKPSCTESSAIFPIMDIFCVGMKFSTHTFPYVTYHPWVGSVKLQGPMLYGDNPQTHSEGVGVGCDPLPDE